MSVSLKFHCKFILEDYIEINRMDDSIVLSLYNSYENKMEEILLDKSTAIKLSKELRKQIALMD